MKVSTKGRFALRLMIDIVNQEDGGFISLSAIAKRQDISVKYLEQIVSRLTKAGLLRSERGLKGGYMLARPAQTMTVWDVLVASEGSLAPVACLEDTECPRQANCPAQGFWQGLYETIYNYCKGVTLAQFAQGGPEVEFVAQMQDALAPRLSSNW